MAAAFLCVLFAQQSRNKCTAAVLGKLTSGAKEIKMDRGSPLRRYFAACSTVWLSHDMYHGRASDPIQMKNEQLYSKIQSSLSPVEKYKTTLPGLIIGWKISLDMICLGNLPLIFSNCLIWSSSMVQLVPKRRLPLCDELPFRPVS